MDRRAAAAAARTGRRALTDDQLYALTAYILQVNGIIGAGDVINAETLPKVQMPNRDGFIRDPRPVGKATPPKK